jgi:hypothetical protein
MKQIFRMSAPKWLILGFACWVPMCGASELFPAKDSNLRLFGTYLDQAEDKWGGGIGLDYFATAYAGIGISTHMENTDGTAIDNVASEIYLRWPIEKWHLAPYAVGGGGYDFGRKSGWFQAVGGGLELRFKKRFGIFADYQYVFHDDYDDSVIRAGIRVK